MSSQRNAPLSDLAARNTDAALSSDGWDPYQENPAPMDPIVRPTQADIVKWYQAYLGRVPSTAEIMSHMQNPGGAVAVEALLKGSPEAKTYADSKLTPSPSPTTPTPTGSTQYRGQLEGFEHSKLDGDRKSPKYVFARIAQGYDIRDEAQRKAMIEALKADPSGFFKDAALDGDTLTFTITDPSYFSGRTGKLGIDVIKSYKGGDPNAMRVQWLDPIDAVTSATPTPTPNPTPAMPAPWTPRDYGPTPNWGGTPVPPSPMPNELAYPYAPGNATPSSAAPMTPEAYRQLVASQQIQAVPPKPLSALGQSAVPTRRGW